MAHCMYYRLDLLLPMRCVDVRFVDVAILKLGLLLGRLLITYTCSL